MLAVGEQHTIAAVAKCHTTIFLYSITNLASCQAAYLTPYTSTFDLSINSGTIIIIMNMQYSGYTDKHI